MGNIVGGRIGIKDGALEASIRIPITKTQRQEVSSQASTDLFDFSAFGLSKMLVTSLVGTIQTTLRFWIDHALDCMCGASSVLSEIDEAWLNELMAEFDVAIDMRTKSKTQSLQQPPIEADETCIASNGNFLGPHDITASKFTSLGAWVAVQQQSVKIEFDCASCTTEETESSSDLDTCSDVKCHCDENEYYSEDDDIETKADRLLRLASKCSFDDSDVYVEDYLCKCGECPAYKCIEHDVKQTMSQCSLKHQRSTIRVLQALSTYNEIVGYDSEMVSAADECLQMWLGDEDRAFKAMVIMFDQVPQFCNNLL